MTIQTQGGSSLLVLALCAVLLAGCAASGAVYSEHPVPPGKSLVYVYREGHILGGANSWTLFANGRIVTDVGNGGYYDFTVDPGRVEFTSLLDVGVVNFVGSLLVHSMRPESLCTLQAEPGQVYFFNYKIGPKMSQVTRDEAIKAMTGMGRFDDPKPVPQ